jgi:hypothetical protein
MDDKEAEKHPEKCKCWICDYKCQTLSKLAQRGELRPYYRHTEVGMFNHGDAVIMPKPDEDGFFR